MPIIAGPHIPTLDDLDPIEQRWRAQDAAGDYEYVTPDWPRLAGLSADDVPQLLAWIRNLIADRSGGRDLT